VKVSTDGANEANITTLPSAINSTAMVKVALSAAEMNGDYIGIQFTDAAGAEWCDLHVTIQTATRATADLAYPTTSGRSIDVTATGEVGIDLDNTAGTLQDADIDTLSVDVVSVSGDGTAADNLEADYDGTGYNKSASTIGTASTVTAAAITTTAPVQSSGDVVAVIGDDYSNTDGMAWSWSITNPSSGNTLDLTGATIAFTATGATASDDSDWSPASTTVATATGATLAFRAEPTSTETATLAAGSWPFQVEATLSGGRIVPMVEGTLVAKTDRA